MPPHQPDGRAPDATTNRAPALAAIIKSARDVMRKDKGLSGELDRLPALTWVMFLKFLDDFDRLREDESVLTGGRFSAALEAPYRWRDWAGADSELTGDELITFINGERAVRPDGSLGPGLFAYLRQLQPREPGDRRAVIATVFRGVTNRMINGYLLRDVLALVDRMHFDVSAEVHTLGHLYETMLTEMRDAAGDSGEFYTPRPVVRFMVQALAPKLGERLLDPACGTAGFLTESYEYLERQCTTVKDRRTLQSGSILGGEAKPLPYLMAQMNLVLHGLEAPQIDAGNSLRVALRDLADADRVDVILTNPPFGGEEERGILDNFPADRQTTETALLFLQLIMRRLRRPPRPGRAGVVVPNGTLFADGVAARIRGDLLRDFNVHTVVRLPKGVFAPYTTIETNLLFFDRSGPTESVWFYEIPLPEGRKTYTKTKPLPSEAFDKCLAWWGDREPTRYAWTVAASELAAQNFNLDQRNPTAVDDVAAGDPRELLSAISAKQEAIGALLGEMQAALGAGR